VLFLPVEAAYEAKRLGPMTARQNAILKKYKCDMQLFRKLPHMSKLARFVASNFVQWELLAWLLSPNAGPGPSSSLQNFFILAPSGLFQL
jgi:hypothetical protein